MMGLGDFVHQLPGNQQDLSLPGSRAAFQAPHDVLPNTEDWTFIESIGQEAGRFSVDGPLPGRYYGVEWMAPRGYQMPAAGAAPGWLAPNSGIGTSPAWSQFNPVLDQILQANAASQAPAADLAAVQNGQPMGPVTLTTPMPSVLQPRRDQVTADQVSQCGLAQWVSKNPLLAVGGAVALYFVLRGRK